MDNTYVHYIVETMEDVDFDKDGAMAAAINLAHQLKQVIKIYRCVGYVQYYAPTYHVARE
jgi:hypothetical protein